jgi:RimJ/RimL family protein N-acetyltransferase
MKLERFASAADFYERAERHLLRHEACHSLMLGIARQLVEHPELFPEVPYLATVEEGEEVIAEALMTPPHNPVLSLGFTPEGLRLLAQDLNRSYRTLPGVLGPVDAARSFAGTWEDLSGQPYRIKRAERVHRLEKVIPAAGVPGGFRQATEADWDLLTEWFVAFGKEALGEDIDPEAAGRSVDAYLATEGMGLYLWENEEPVSTAGRSRPNPNGTTVNYVYTPPEHRNKGYASACVAALSQLLLDEGYQYCFLFTDLANPTSNKIYKAIGYEPVCDVDEYEFRRVTGGRDSH